MVKALITSAGIDVPFVIRFETYEEPQWEVGSKCRNLSFSVLHGYGTSGEGIVVPVILSVGEEAIGLTARVDTGSTFCVFQRGYEEALGIDTERGLHGRIGIVTGGFDAFGHALTLNALGYTFNVVVCSLRNTLSPGTFSAGAAGSIRSILASVEYEGKLYIWLGMIRRPQS